MKTDKDKLKALLTEFGVTFKEDLNNCARDEFNIIVEKDDNPKIVGYNGFFTDFTFDAEGKFIEMGAWE